MPYSKISMSINKSEMLNYMKSSKREAHILQTIIHTFRSITSLFVRRYDVLPFQITRMVEKFDVVTPIARNPPVYPTPPSPLQSRW